MIHLLATILILIALMIKELTRQLLKLIIKISNLLHILIGSAIRDTQLSKKLYCLALLDLQGNVFQQLYQWLYLICILVSSKRSPLCSDGVLQLSLQFAELLGAEVINLLGRR